MQRWVDSSETVLAKVASDGDLTAHDITATGDLFVGSTNVITHISANTASGVAISGWAEQYIDSKDFSGSESSGTLQPQITKNSADIIVVSGLTQAGADFMPHASGDYFLTEIRANSASGSVNAADILVVSGIADAAGLPEASGGAITANTNLIHSSGNFLLNEISSSGAAVSGLANTAVTAVSGYAQGYTDLKITNLIDGAPAALDTLNEIANALDDDANIAGTLTTLISNNTTSIDNLNIFDEVRVAGQDNIVASTHSDILTLAAGSNITLTTSASTDTITIAAENSDERIYASGDFLLQEIRANSASGLSNQTALNGSGNILLAEILANSASGATNASLISTTSGNLQTQITSNDGDITQLNSDITTVSGLIPSNTFSITGGDGNDYTIDGMGLNSAYDPTIYMHKGQTYTFNKTFSGHPFRVSATDGGSVYSDADGTAIEIGSAAGSVTFEIPQDAPDKLYYYCTAHASSMKGIIYTTTDGSLSGYFESRADSADTNISTNSSSITANSGYFESRVDQTDADIATVSGLLYDDSAVSGYFESRVDANTTDIVTVSGIAGLTVRDIDGTPSISNVTTIRVTNGSLTDNGGGTVTIATSGSGGDSSYDDTAISGYFESRVDSADSAITANSGYFESRVDSADSTATANSGYFESRVDTNAADIITVSGLTGGSSSLTVRDVDGTPSVSNVTTIEVTNGSLTDQGGGVVRIATSGSGGGGGGASSTGVPSGVGFFDNSGSLSGNNTFIYDGSDIKVSGRIFASGEQVITSDEIFHIKQLTQAEYDAITPESSTFYIISDAGSSSVIQSYREVASNTTILATDYTINATSPLVLTLPTAVGNEGLLYNIKNTSTGNVIVSGVSSQTIDGELSFEISTQYQSIEIQSTNSNWVIL